MREREDDLDDLFHYQKEDDATYFCPQIPKEQIYDVEPSGGTATTPGKNEAIARKDEAKDTAILEVSGGESPTAEPPIGEPTIGETPVKANGAGTIGTEVKPLKVVSGEMARNDMVLWILPSLRLFQLGRPLLKHPTWEISILWLP